VRIVLKQEKRLYVLENSIPNSSTEDAEEKVRNGHQRHVDDNEQAACVMLVSMSPEFQRQHENMDVHTIIMHLKELFYKANKTERYETFKELLCCKMTESSSVNTHVLKMIGYNEKLS
jgi:hypothetical protein